MPRCSSKVHIFRGEERGEMMRGFYFLFFFLLLDFFVWRDCAGDGKALLGCLRGIWFL